MSTSLVSELERLADALESDGAGAVEGSLPAVAEKIARELRVKAEEVAILAVFASTETPIFSGAARTEKCGIHSAHQQFGAGRANRARQPARDQQQFLRRCGMPPYLKE